MTIVELMYQLLCNSGLHLYERSKLQLCLSPFIALKIKFPVTRQNLILTDTRFFQVYYFSYFSILNSCAQ